MDKKRSSSNKPPKTPKTRTDLPSVFLRGKSVGKRKAGASSAIFSDKPKSKSRVKVSGASSVAGDTERQKSTNNKSFPVVGIGASAGGLEAFTQLLQHLPSNTGMAFVFIQHLDPTHESILTEILSRATDMPVKKVEDGMPVKPNHVYVIPPNTNMGISLGILNLIARPKTSAPHIPIDIFFRTLAEDRKSKAIGVILSGTGSDGAIGLEQIKAEGGITFVQDEKSAKYDGMPRSAISTGYVDFILPPEGIARELARIGTHPYVARPKTTKVDELIPESEDSLRRIFTLLRVATGADFTNYKPATIKRRILRRMALNKIDKLEDYIKYMKSNAAEVQALYQDVLIKVTGFFRDPQAFQVLKSRVFPSIIRNRSPKEPIRIWVPGCSTGEEAYSIAICLIEFLGTTPKTNIPIQIFATDISEVAIERARAGIYIENIVADVSQERLRRFFTKMDRGYQINKSIREMCVFARQDITRDPPFSKLDLISCRNVLIYLGPPLQRKIMSIFHYALKPTGFLLLGTSETVGTSSDLFSLVDKKNKIYSKKAAALHPAFDFIEVGHGLERVAKGDSIGGPKDEVWGELDVQKEADRIILNRYTPAGVVINDNMDIVQFRGQTIPYLELFPGKASLNLMKMAREGLFVELRAAIQKARKQGVPVRRKGLHVRRDGEFRDVNIEVVLINSHTSKERYFLVLFEDAKPQSADEGKRTKKTEVKRTECRRVSQLNQELAATKEYLRAVIEEQEATNEELKSANEEILSSNEELQSTNEELETAKEELQSINEELTTVNEELQNRNFELSQFNNDLNNLLGSVNMPIIMVGSDLCIRRFTPMAEKILNLIPADIGRSISNINLNIDVPNLEQLISDVIETVTVKEQEIQDHNGRWYSIRIRPYRTVENEINGAVIMLVDISERKRAEETKRKEILLKEIHHGVKNGLRIISSLLNLQSGYVKDPEALEMFKETQSRIRSMSLIHEQLYKNMELVNIDFNNYIQN
jgi:two-component system CheB/CheR fusion protein